MSNTLGKKFSICLKNATQRAYQIAGKATAVKPVGVWEVMVPIIFIMNFFANRQRRDLFAQNVLFTKKLALTGARDIRKNDLAKDDIHKRIIAQTDQVLAADEAGVYSEAIRASQMEEIDLLIEHYLKLLDAEGKTYPQLVRAAYPGRVAFQGFLNSLGRAEKNVVETARKSLGPQTDTRAMNRLLAATLNSHKREFDEIFSP
jgi:hypothetical protein